MKITSLRFTAAFICFLGICSAQAELSEVTTSSAPTQYCFNETSVRGGFDRIIIDHHLIIPQQDQFKKGDVYVGVKFKSKPNELWLLSGLVWRKITKDQDLLNAQYQGYEELPLVIPVTVFNDPVDIRSSIGDGEIWVGYGLRAANEGSIISFNEMMQNKRYDFIWEALPSPNYPINGLRHPTASICIKTSEVKKTLQTVTVD